MLLMLLQLHAGDRLVKEGNCGAAGVTLAIHDTGLRFRSMTRGQARLEEARQELQRLKAQRGVQGRARPEV
jgi:hypothetical protein